MKSELIKPPKVAVVLASYNERDNIGPLLSKIAYTLDPYDYEIVIVDDNSPDRTYEVVKAMSATYPIQLIRRPKKMGLASAVLTGFLSSEGDYLVCLDADGQHDPEVIPRMIEELEKGADIVVGSRFVGGDIDPKWSHNRNLMSHVATFLASPFTSVKDPMSGFFAVRRGVLESISDWYLIGYKVLLEILVKARSAKVVEIPIHFGVRHYGRSKLNWREVLLYLILITKLFWWRIRSGATAQDDSVQLSPVQQE